MINKNVRIKDIALKAKVSTGTVDRVLHNRGKVAESVRERILEIITEMDYRPNLMARALGSNKIYNIAALIPEDSNDPYWFAPKAGIEKAEKDLKQYGINVNQFLFDQYNTDSFIKQAQRVTESHPDGVFLAPVFYKEILPFFEKWKEKKIPFVLFNSQISDFNPLSYIGQDSYQSGLLAAKLIHFSQPYPGSVLIVHIDEKSSNATHLNKKEQGFRDYFLQHKLEQYIIIKVELNRSDPIAFNHELDRVIAGAPDLSSIFVTTSKASDIANYLEQRQIKHIKIIGYDLLPKNIHYLNKGDISFLINQNPKGQGYWGIYQLTDFLVFKKEVSNLKYLPLDIVTKENLSYYIDEDSIYNDIV